MTLARLRLQNCVRSNNMARPERAVVKRTRKSNLEPKDEPAVASAPEVKADEIAARITPLELGDLVHALSDEKLAYLVTAATRDLKRRLARGGFQRRSRLAKGRASDLERAIRQVAEEFRGAALPDEW